jgi:Rrf2 family protein
MLELALNYGKGNMLLKDIAMRQEISIGYLEHLIPPLKAAGFVNASRGARGGYTLAKSPSDINLKEILLLMEGSLSPVECVDNPKFCGRINYCVTQDIWKELGEKIAQTLESTTLQDLAERQKEKTENFSLYHI